MQKTQQAFLLFFRKRPYIILKWAQTHDGFIAPDVREERAPVWITSKYTKQLVHKWRSEEQAILVGTNTAVADNPQLNTRLWKGSSPVRVVIDQHLRIPKNSALFDGSVKTIFICAEATSENEQHWGDNIVYEKSILIMK